MYVVTQKDASVLSDQCESLGLLFRSFAQNEFNLKPRQQS